MIWAALAALVADQQCKSGQFEVTFWISSIELQAAQLEREVAASLTLQATPSTSISGLQKLPHRKCYMASKSIANQATIRI